MTEATPVLVTLLPSTDVDLGRWLLQHYGVDYRESPHAPVFHVFALKWHGVGADDYPLLLLGERKVPTIDKILPTYDPKVPAERQLLPADAQLRATVIDAGRDFRFKMGGGVVDWAYYNFLPHRRLTWASFTTGVPWYEVVGVAVGYPLIRLAMTKALKLDAKRAQQGLDAVHQGFDQVDALLADGREFLYGDRLGYADLAFAASAAPMVLARGYGGHLPTLDAVTEPMREVMAPLRERPAGRFVQRLYDRFRKA